MIDKTSVLSRAIDIEWHSRLRNTKIEPCSTRWQDLNWKRYQLLAIWNHWLFRQNWFSTRILVLTFEHHSLAKVILNVSHTHHTNSTHITGAQKPLKNIFEHLKRKILLFDFISIPSRYHMYPASLYVCSSVQFHKPSNEKFVLPTLFFSVLFIIKIKFVYFYTSFPLAASAIKWNWLLFYFYFNSSLSLSSCLIHRRWIHLLIMDSFVFR